MNKQGLKEQIENLAKEMNVDFITACKSMQTASASLGKEDLIVVINELKLEFLGL